jgi:hypothetical protein
MPDRLEDHDHADRRDRIAHERAHGRLHADVQVAARQQRIDDPARDAAG